MFMKKGCSVCLEAKWLIILMLFLRESQNLVVKSETWIHSSLSANQMVANLICLLVNYGENWDGGRGLYKVSVCYFGVGGRLQDHCNQVALTIPAVIISILTNF